MRGVVAVACAMLVSLGASGCFVAEDDPETQADAGGALPGSSGGGSGTSSGGAGGGSTAKSGTAGSTSGGSTGGANGTNSAPTASLAASAASGPAPHNVTFSINGTDADGDNLTWSLALDGAALGNGTTVPAQLNHTFTEAGNYTVVLTVMDGAANATANVTVTVTAAEGGEPPAPQEDDWVVFNPDGTCDAKGEIGAIIYVHERGDPPGTGFFLGDGTWIYQESNDIGGLQVGGPGDPSYAACLNPDTLIF